MKILSVVKTQGRYVIGYTEDSQLYRILLSSHTGYRDVILGSGWTNLGKVHNHDLDLWRKAAEEWLTTQVASDSSSEWTLIDWSNM